MLTAVLACMAQVAGGSLLCMVCRCRVMTSPCPRALIFPLKKEIEGKVKFPGRRITGHRAICIQSCWVRSSAPLKYFDIRNPQLGAEPLQIPASKQRSHHPQRSWAKSSSCWQALKWKRFLTELPNKSCILLQRRLLFQSDHSLIQMSCLASPLKGSFPSPWARYQHAG